LLGERLDKGATTTEIQAKQLQLRLMTSGNGRILGIGFLASPHLPEFPQ
jgi:hypothetical protein